MNKHIKRHINRWIAGILAVVLLITGIPMQNIQVKAEVTSDWVEMASATQGICAAYGNGFFLSMGTDAIYRSIDGREWEKIVELPWAYAATNLRYIGERFYCNRGSDLLTSTDGIVWEKAITGYTNSPVYAQDAYYVISASSFGVNLCRSENGISWQVVRENLPYSPYLLRGMAYGNGVLVVLAGSDGEDVIVMDLEGNILQKSKVTDDNSTRHSFKLVYTQGHFLAADQSGIFLSEDGYAWRQISEEPITDALPAGSDYCAITEKRELLCFDNIAQGQKTHSSIGLESYSSLQDQYNCCFVYGNEVLLCIGRNKDYVYSTYVRNYRNLMEEGTAGQDPSVSGNTPEEYPSVSGNTPVEIPVLSGNTPVEIPPVGGNETGDEYLTEDLTIEGDYTLTAKRLHLNGHQLTVSGTLTCEDSTIFAVDGGGVTCGSLLIAERTMLSGQIAVKGNLTIQKAYLKCAQAQITVGGDLLVADSAYNYGFTMTHPQDEITVSGNLVYDAPYELSKSQGTLSVAGNFSVSKIFTTGEAFTLVLNGSKRQELTLTEGCYFGIVRIENTAVEGVYLNRPLVAERTEAEGKKLFYGEAQTEGVCGYTLTQDEQIEGDFCLAAGVLDLNGHSLTVQGDFIQPSGVVKVNGGCLQVEGDYHLQDKEGEDTYRTGHGVLQMTQADDRVYVKGSLYVQTDRKMNGLLTAGELSVCGDLVQESGVPLLASDAHCLRFARCTDGQETRHYVSVLEGSHFKTIRLEPADWYDFEQDMYEICDEVAAEQGLSLPAKPQVRVVKESCAAITLQWDGAADEALTFRVYRKKSDDYYPYQLLADNVEDCFYKDETVSNSDSYAYKVVAVSGCHLTSEYSDVKYARCKRMYFSYNQTPRYKNTPGKENIQLQIMTESHTGAVDHTLKAEYYNFSEECWAVIGEIAITGEEANSYYVTRIMEWDYEGVRENQTVKVRFTLSDEDGVNDTKECTFRLDLIAPDTPSQLKAVDEHGNVKLSWYEKSSNCTEYDIYRQEDGKEAVKIETTTQKYFVDTDVEVGKCYRYFIYAFDAQGNGSQPGEVEIQLLPDEERPKVTISKPSEGSWLRESVDISAKAVDNRGLSVAELYIEDEQGGRTLLGSYEADSYEKTVQDVWDTTEYADGAYKILLRAQDSSGNWSEERVSCRVDNTKPGRVKNPQYRATDTEIELLWEKTEDETLRYYEVCWQIDSGYRYNYDVGVNYKYSAYSDHGLKIDYQLKPETTYDFDITPVDEAGNRGETTRLSVTTMHDSQPPKITRCSPASGEYYGRFGNYVSITVEYEDNIACGGVSLSYTQDGRNYTQITSCEGSGTRYQYMYYSWDFSDVPDGKTTVLVTVFDPYGNMAQKEIQMTLDRTPPVAPQNFTAEVVNGGIRLTWNTPDEDIMQFSVSRKDTPDAASYPSFTVDGSKREFFDTGLTEGKKYYYSICAIDYAWNYTNIDQPIQIRYLSEPDTEAPGQVPYLTCTKQTGSAITFSWGEAKDNVAVDYYKVYRDGVQVGRTQENVYTDRDASLREDQKYTYRVTAVDESGNESENSPVLQAGLIMPVIGEVSPKDHGKESGDSTRVSAQVINQSGRNKKRCCVSFYDPQEEKWTVILDETREFTYTGQSQTFYQYWNRAGQPDGVYTLRYELFDEDANRAVKEIAYEIDNTPPAIPAITDVEPGCTGARVTWSAPSEPDCKEYRIERLADNGSWAALSRQESNTIELKDLSPQRQYQYRICAVDDVGNQSAWAVVSVETLPDTEPPSVVPHAEVTKRTSGSVRLQWGRAADNVGVTGYRVYRDKELVAETEWQTEYTDSGLQPETAYTYEITAMDAAGNESEQKKTVSVETVLPVITDVTPAEGSVIGDAETDICFHVLSDRLSGDRQADISVYDSISETWKSIHTQTIPAAGQTDGKAIAVKTTWDTTALTQDMDIQLRVAVTDEDGGRSEKVITCHLDRTAPEIPADFRGSEKDAKITLEWTKSPDGDCRLYRIYRKIEGGQEAFEQLAEVRAGKETYTLTDRDVVAPQTYYYCLETEDAFGNSRRSEPMEVFADVDKTPPTPPSDISVRRRTGSSITVSWSGATDNVAVTGYNLYRNDKKIAENIKGAEYKDSGADLAGGLQMNEPYLYTVTALDEAGNESKMSPHTEGAVFMPKITQITPQDQSLIGGGEIMLSAYFTDSGNSRGNRVYFKWYDAQSGIWRDITAEGCAQQYGGWGLLKAECAFTLPEFSGQEDEPIDIKAVLVDEDGNQSESVITLIVDRTPPMPPAKLTARESSGVIALSFTPSSSADTQGYYIYRKEEMQESYSCIAEISGRMNSWYNDNTVQAQKNYTYRISAYDAFGQEGPMGEETDMICAGTDNEAPKIRSMTPQPGRVNGRLDIQVEGSDNRGIESVDFYIRTGEQEWSYLGTQAAADNKASYIWDTGEYEDGEYYIKAVVKDAAGNENENLFQRRYEIDHTGPAKIRLGNCSAGAAFLHLEWQDVTEDDFAYFAVEEKHIGASEEPVWTEIGKVTDSLGMNITDRQPGQSYTLRVVGYDTLGNRGEESDEITLTTSEDTAAPVIQRIDPVSSSYGDSLPLSMTVTDNVAVMEGIFSYSTDGENYTELKRVSASGNRKQETLSYTWDTSALAEGKVWVRFEAVDTAGLSNALPSGGDIVNTYLIDHTAPAPVKGLIVTENDGCVGLGWEESASETDIKAYRIYRSMSQAGEYTCICETATKNHYDTDVKMGKTYFYKISSVDLAGNESALSSPVKATVAADTTAPSILGISPQSGTLLGRSAAIALIAADNSALSGVRIEYREKESNDIWCEIEEKDVSGRQQYLQIEWDTSQLKENTEYELRAVAFDEAGNVSEPFVRTYTLDLTPPETPSIQAQTGSRRIELSVSAPAEQDFDCCEIYRRAYGESGFTYIYSMKEPGEYTDTTTEPDKIYYYKAVSYDAVGNKAESETVYSHASSVDTIDPVASLPETIMAVAGLSLRFDGTQSTDDVRIQSYEWKFGDGTSARGSRPSHTYKEAGSYTVILTVTDAAGNFGQTTATVIVLDGEENGQSLVRVIDTDGNPVAGANIYVKNGNDEEDVIRTRTDAAGEVLVSGKAGIYEMAAYAQGFMPKDEQIRISNYEKLTKEIVLTSGEVVTGELSAHRLTLEELVEKGIDLTDPENYNTYSFRVELAFEAAPLPVVYEQTGVALLVKPNHDMPSVSGSAYVFHAENGGNYVQAVCEQNESGQMQLRTLIYLWTTQSVSWLKDMYSVDLEVINHADSGFSIEQASATLSLPDGLSLMQKESGKTLTENMGTIEGQSRKKVSWVVRGDKNGSYPLSASFSGLLMPFEEPINMTFETTQDIEVTSGEGLYILIEPEDAAYYAEKYYIQFTLSNQSDKTFYNLTTSFGEYEHPAFKEEVIVKDPDTGAVMDRSIRLTGKTYRSAGANKCKSIPLLYEGDRINVGVFEPGESIRGTCKFTISGGDGDSSYLELVNSFVRQLEGENLGVTVKIKPINSHISKSIYVGLRPGESAEDIIEYGDPVDAASGAFTQQINALQLGGSLSLGLSYNSMLADVKGEAGNGFSHSYESFVKDLGGMIELHTTPASQIDFISEEYEQGVVFGYSAGTEIVLDESAPYLGAYRPVGNTMQGAAIEKIEDAEGLRYELTDTDGTVTTFDAEGKVTSRRKKGKDEPELIIQRDGDTAQVKDTVTGECIKLTYTDGLLTQASDSHGRSVSFTYDKEGNLTTFTDALGQTNSFTYDKEHRILAAYDPAGIQLCENTYDSEGRVLTQKEAGSEKSSAFTYKDTEDGGTQTSIKKRDGSAISYETDATGNVIKNIDERGNTTEFIYDKKGQLLDEIAPDGSTTMYEYDDAGQLKAVYDTAANVTTYTYDTDGNPVRIQGNEGEASYFSYDADGNPVSYTSPLGARTTYTYDDNGNVLTQSIEGLGTKTFAYRNGRLTKSTDFSGNETVLTYDAYGNINSVRDALGNIERTTYDALGRIKNSTDALGNVTTYDYDKSGNQIRMTTGGRSMHYEYDEAGRMTAMTDPEGNTTGYAYDSEGNLIKTTFPDGSVIRCEYDAVGNLIGQTDADGMEHTYVYDEMNYLIEETHAGLTTTYTYYPNGKPRTITNPDGTSHTYTYDRYWNMISDMDQSGHTTSYTYDPTGNCLSVIDALGNTTSYTYDCFGRMTEQTDPEGNTTSYAYDADGRCVEQKNAQGTVTQMKYDALGRLLSSTLLMKDEGGKTKPVTVSYAYDALGRTTQTTDAQGNTTSYAYDNFGNLTQTTAPDGTVTGKNTYDGLNRLLTQTDSLGTCTTLTYDNMGNTTSIEEGAFIPAQNNAAAAGPDSDSARTRKTAYTYDKAGRILTATDPAGSVTKASYDSAGRTVSTTDAMGGVTTYSYDTFGRPIAVTTAIGTTEKYTYNDEGLIGTIENDGEQPTDKKRQTELTYDALGRIESRKDDVGMVSYTYDKNGNLLTVTEQLKGSIIQQKISRTYDSLNRVTSYTDYNGNTVKYTYDELGNRLSLTYPGGEIVRYTYDGNSRMTSAVDPDGGVTTYTYDQNGRLKTQTRPDGSTETYTYDTQGQLTGQKDVAADGSTIHEYTYAYDQTGNIIKTTGFESSRGGADGQDTQIDAVMTYDADNRLVTYNGRAVKYDNAGNMTYGPLDGGMANYIYDCRNRLIEVQTEDGKTIHYTYDAENNRIEETDGQTKTTYINDPEATYSQLLTETTYTKNIFGAYTKQQQTTTYTYGQGLISAKTQYSGTDKNSQTEQTSYYHYNNIGCTTQITDQKGVIQYNIAYGPYGELTQITDKDGNSVSIGTNQKDNSAANSPASASLRFLYNGQLGVQTDQNGLYYMRARYYNTDIKRFINRDTVSGDLTNSQSLNRYAYVQGNPINQTDPFGLYPIGDALNILSQAGHMLLDTAGMFFDAADLLNAAWYAAEGNTLMAASCAVSSIPFLGSVVAGGTKLAIAGGKAVKAAGCIKEVSVMVGFTGMAVLGAINTAQAYKNYKDAKANGTATFSDGLNVALNAIFTVGAGICALSAATKVKAKLKAGGVDAKVKASAAEGMSGKGGSKGGSTTGNYTYRAMNSKDYDRYMNGLGLEAKNPNGEWTLKDHLINGSSKKSWDFDPYISTTSDLRVAEGFNQSGSGYGIVKIDMDKVTSPSYKGYEEFSRVNGIEGLAYHYSIWQQEISVYQNIPFEAIVDYFN